MAYVSTAVNNLALIVVLFAVIKMLILLFKPQAWMNFAKGIYKNTVLVQIVGLVLAGVVLYYLTGAGITIVQIMAVMAFLGSLLMIGLATQIDDLVAKFETQIKKGNILKENWLYTLIWVMLLVWAIKELFI